MKPAKDSLSILSDCIINYHNTTIWHAGLCRCRVDRRCNGPCPATEAAAAMTKGDNFACLPQELAIPICANAASESKHAPEYLP